MNSSKLYNKLKKDFFIIAGPCVIESEKNALEIAEKLKKISEELNIEIIFKASFDKANRSSINSFRGLGIDKGLDILSKVKTTYDLNITTDVHEPNQVNKVSDIVDIIQIPALLCRQTDLILAAAKSQKIVNIKKGQFMSPYEIKYAVQKAYTLNNKVMITERGTSFGYNRLVVDMSGIVEMKNLNVPLIFDATHSVQLPGSNEGSSGGNVKYVKELAKAATAIGISGVFFETHIHPDDALSDSKCMINITDLKQNLIDLININKLVKGEFN